MRRSVQTGALPVLEVAQGLALPVVTLAVYGLLLGLDVFSVHTPLLHGIAAVLWILWLIQASRSALGFWAHRMTLRFFIPLVLCVIFGACWSVAPAPTARAWVDAPSYVKRPPLPLPHQTATKPVPPAVLGGGTVHIAFQGATAGSLAVRFKGREERKTHSEKGGETVFSFEVPAYESSKLYRVTLRQGLRRLGAWTFRVEPDRPPTIALTEPPAMTARKTIRFSYETMDDYQVESILVRLTPLAETGGALPEPQEILLSQPFAQKARATGTIDLTHLPWAGRSVAAQVVAVDGAGRRGVSASQILALPERSWNNPFARALIEERQKLLERQDPATRDEVANVLAGIARQQGGIGGDPLTVLALRAAAVRIALSPNLNAARAVAHCIWQAALRIEEGPEGQAYAVLAEAQNDLLFALIRDTHTGEAAVYAAQLQDAVLHYAETLEAERVRQPPALQAVDWPIVTAQDMLVSEDLQQKAESLRALIQDGKKEVAQARLIEWKKELENSRALPPELTPEQAHLAGQIAALRALLRGQRAANEAADGASQKQTRTLQRIALSQAVIQQQMMLAALRDIVKEGLETDETERTLKAMTLALTFLQRGAPHKALAPQAEALALVENALLALSENIKQSLASSQAQDPVEGKAPRH